MATVTISLQHVCDGGGHVRLVASVDGVQRVITYNADDIRADIDAERMEDALLALLKFHFRGKTRNQVRAELQAGVTMVV